MIRNKSTFHGYCIHASPLNTIGRGSLVSVVVGFREYYHCLHEFMEVKQYNINSWRDESLSDLQPEGKADTNLAPLTQVLLFSSRNSRVLRPNPNRLDAGETEAFVFSLFWAWITASFSCSFHPPATRCGASFSFLWFLCLLIYKRKSMSGCWMLLFNHGCYRADAQKRKLSIVSD